MSKFLPAILNALFHEPLDAMTVVDGSSWVCVVLGFWCHLPSFSHGCLHVGVWALLTPASVHLTRSNLMAPLVICLSMITRCFPWSTSRFPGSPDTPAPVEHWACWGHTSGGHPWNQNSVLCLHTGAVCMAKNLLHKMTCLLQVLMHVTCHPSKMCCSSL